MSVILRDLPIRKGHFRLESGYHGNLWIDLEALCFHPEPIRQLAADLAARLAGYDVEIVCGPLVEGAFVAIFTADALHVPFTYSVPSAAGTSTLFPVKYRLPAPLRMKVRNRRIGIVNDVIGAGSAVRGTHADLLDCGANVVAVASLAIAGRTFRDYAAEHRLPLEVLEEIENEMWEPSACLLCAAGVPLVTP